ncbi:hypothetical protein CS542_07800 [Pedobacter sp. IW39]|nr:hypothetical protein CS542_07800 [Pedobacter sp. IW39]
MIIDSRKEISKPVLAMLILWVISAKRTEFSSMLYFIKGQERLVQIKALEGQYPFRTETTQKQPQTI